jgi:LDH2 family malate/lactate/ureidoglycolate dehydrogenase
MPHAAPTTRPNANSEKLGAGQEKSAAMAVVARMTANAMTGSGFARPNQERSQSTGKPTSAARLMPAIPAMTAMISEPTTNPPESAFEGAVTSVARSVKHGAATAAIAPPARADRRQCVGGYFMRPNVRAKRAPTAGRQARAGENVPRTARPGLAACRWRSA